MELQNARKVEKARLKAASKSKPTPTLPELTEAIPEKDRDRLLIENQRLAEEVAQLRAQIHEMAGAAGSDAAKPGVTIDGPGNPHHVQIEELHNNTNGGSPHGGYHARLTLPRSREAEARATDASTFSEQARRINPTAAPTPSLEGGVRSGFRGENGTNVSKGARRVSSVKAEGEAHAPSSTVAPSMIKAGAACADDNSCRTWKGGIGKIDEEEFNRLVEIEAATVLEELRANPPPAVKALLRVRQELDACAAAALAVRNSTSMLLSSGLLPAMAGGDVRDGSAGISSSEGTKAALHGVGTMSSELTHR